MGYDCSFIKYKNEEINIYGKNVIEDFIFDDDTGEELDWYCSQGRDLAHLIKSNSIGTSISEQLTELSKNDLYNILYHLNMNLVKVQKIDYATPTASFKIQSNGDILSTSCDGIEVKIMDSNGFVRVYSEEDNTYSELAICKTPQEFFNLLAYIKSIITCIENLDEETERLFFVESW